VDIISWELSSLLDCKRATCLFSQAF
jgi:hypothetical protein